MPNKRPAFTLIGDLVESRFVADRASLQKQLEKVLRRANKTLEPPGPFRSTIGDEFQASFDNPAAAIGASLLIRLALLRETNIDSRYGLGAGAVQTLSGRSQEGPGWWTARDAIEAAAAMAEVPHTSFVRTQFISYEEDDGAEAAALNAFLFCRDAMVDRMRQPSRNRLYGLMCGWPQARIADEEGTTQSAISQSLARSGASAIALAQRRLEAGHW